jgi:hypothetical protein
VSTECALFVTFFTSLVSVLLLSHSFTGALLCGSTDLMINVSCSTMILGLMERLPSCSLLTILTGMDVIQLNDDTVERISIQNVTPFLQN